VTGERAAAGTATTNTKKAAIVVKIDLRNTVSPKRSCTDCLYKTECNAEAVKKQPKFDP
jgi:hypothetical protein